MVSDADYQGQVHVTKRPNAVPGDSVKRLPFSAKLCDPEGKEARMLPSFIIPETVIREPGASPVLSIETVSGGCLVLTLGITRIIEQQSLDMSIWGSADNADWGTKPLIAFPQKFYCGSYQLLLDLTQHPDIKYLRAKWQVSRWGRGDPKPLFGIYLFVQDASRQVAIAKTA